MVGGGARTGDDDDADAGGAARGDGARDLGARWVLQPDQAGKGEAALDRLVLAQVLQSRVAGVAVRAVVGGEVGAGEGPRGEGEAAERACGHVAHGGIDCGAEGVVKGHGLAAGQEGVRAAREHKLGGTLDEQRRVAAACAAVAHNDRHRPARVRAAAVILLWLGKLVLNHARRAQGARTCGSGRTLARRAWGCCRGGAP